MSLGIFFVEVDIGSLNRQPAAVRHGIASIDGEIHDHLLDLPGIGLDLAEIAASTSASSMSSPISRRSMRIARLDDNGVEV